MPYKRTFHFVHSRKYFFILSILITIGGALALGLFGLNYGVDFSSGTNVDINLTKKLQKTDVENVLKRHAVQKEPVITMGQERVTIRFSEVLPDSIEKQLKADMSKLDSGASFEVNTVDVEIARELQRNALLAVAIASLGIIIYVSIRFEWRFAVAAIIALLHDSFMVISLFSLLRLEVNIPFIIAVLTIIGYSINDTIVIFDRIRENMRFAKVKTFHDLASVVNNSIYQTLTRSINTVLTVLIAAFCLFILGSESIRMFALAILFGLLFGAYSSIFIASPLWVVLKSRQKKANVQAVP